MSLQKPLNVAQALEIAQEIKYARDKYGRNGTTMHSQSDIREALAALATVQVAQAEGDGFVTAAEHTKLKRQFAALNARYQKLAGKAETAENEPIEQGYKDHQNG